MISEATEELIRAHWAAQIPAQYRCAGHAASNPTVSAIVSQPPPAPLLAKFFAAISRGMHLTAAQRAAQPPRESMRRGKPGTPPVPECVCEQHD